MKKECHLFIWLACAQLGQCPCGIPCGSRAGCRRFQLKTTGSFLNTACAWEVK